ncbi:MAG TPA: TonB-dependent receptor, partial [Vicinamibacterales bacterium]|nr:TonB-dependent receptor [Vicinamibacterales bacterium]
LPTQIPTTVEGITGEELAVTINATDAEDALKYFPSLLVRKRYVGDYDHAVLASRARTRASSRTPTFRPASANGRVPDWRANAVATYHLGERWLVTLGARYSGQQFNTLDNSDPNGMSYTGVSEFFVVDTRVRYVGDRWNASLGIDNLNNEEYWNFHPYTQRTFAAEIGVEF